VNFTSWQRLSAELVGTAGIVAVVLGASHMAAKMEAAPSIDLIMNALATAGALFVLISVFSAVSGAHFNPVVTLALWLRKQISTAIALGYMLFQVAGGVLGAVLANLMFTDQVIAVSAVERAGTGVFLGEVIASFGLVLLILILAQQGKSNWIPAAVPLWILAGYFFTASTSFANPAVSIGRAFSDAGSSIAWSSVPMFIAAQILGALLAVATAAFFKSKTER
jgi:glycerol uptake facilitator-like aquaporin